MESLSGAASASSMRPPDSPQATIASLSRMPAFAGLQTLLYGLVCMYSGALALQEASTAMRRTAS